MLSQLDLRLASLAHLEFMGAGSNPQVGRVKFQFPPRLVSDGKDIEWSEGPLRGGEPLAYFKTSGARKIRLEWTYIVGESGGNGDGGARYWSADDVSKEVAGVRWYFYNIGSNDNGSGAEQNLVCRFRLWHHGHTVEPFTVRMNAVDIKHGKTLFVPSDDPTKAYPLRTDVGVDLRLWTNSRDSEGDKQRLNLRTFSDYPQWR